MSFEELAEIIEKVEVKVEKFDGDEPEEGEPDTRVLRERVTFVDGVMQSWDFFDEDGKLIKTLKEV